MFRERIIEHAERVAQILEEYPDIAKIEQNTKDFLIRPFFECLGFDPKDPGQVFSEVTTDAGKKKVDFMLTGEGGVKVAVEAKSASTTLSAADIQQLREYFTFSKAVAGILTNGVQYWLFADLDTTNVMDSEPYHVVTIEDLKDISRNDLSHLETLTRSRVRQKAVRHQARLERYRGLVNEVVAKELDSPSKSLLELIGKKAGITPSKANLQLLEPLVGKAIQRHLGVESPSQPKPSSTPPDKSREPPQTPSSPTNPSSSPDTKDPSVGKALSTFKRAKLFGKVLPAKSYRQMLIAVVAELRVRHSNEIPGKSARCEELPGKTVVGH